MTYATPSPVVVISRTQLPVSIDSNLVTKSVPANSVNGTFNSPINIRSVSFVP